ncbi:hypothetical protein ACH5RR_023595 [Cinchona calisaya]|uniref:DUF4219 domain-containing protein n=1 Tax=Cinchona calisaya TaxID=153742 RepID=A0ABD2ZG49_9GENT
MTDITVGHIKKLNNHNFSKWKSCIESYLESQDLLEYVTGSDATPPPRADATALCKWKVKAAKAMFALKMSTFQGWATQPTIDELENLLENQESLAKQMADVLVKNEEEALYSTQPEVVQER